MLRPSALRLARVAFGARPRLTRALAAGAGAAAVVQASYALGGGSAARAALCEAEALPTEAGEYVPPPPIVEDPEENAKILAAWRAHIQEARELFRKRDIDGAERKLLLALEAAAHFGQVSGPVATSLLNLAQLYRRAARFAEAEPLLVRAAGILDETAGPNNKVTLLALLDLAGTRFELGNALASAECYDDVLKRLEVAVLNQPHGRDALLDVRAGCLLQSAKAQQALGELGEAERHLREALSIAEGRWGKSSPRLLAPCAELARVVAKRGAAAEAAALLARARALPGIRPAALSRLDELDREVAAAPPPE